jgi:hypothetical protein
MQCVRVVNNNPKRSCSVCEKWPGAKASEANGEHARRARRYARHAKHNSGLDQSEANLSQSHVHRWANRSWLNCNYKWTSSRSLYFNLPKLLVVQSSGNSRAPQPQPRRIVANRTYAATLKISFNKRAMGARLTLDSDCGERSAS